MTVGDIIKQARLLKGYTQEELAELVGVQKSAIAKWETGRVSEIKRSNLQGLAQALGINPNDLVGGWKETEASIKAMEKKNDALTDIVLKLNNDVNFFDVVKKISKLSPEQMEGLKTFLK